MTSSVLYAGDRVHLQGLLNRPELNGKEGILKEKNLQSERWTVKLSEDASEVALKETNLQLVLLDGISLRQKLPCKPSFHPGHFLRDKSHLMVDGYVQTVAEKEPPKPVAKPKPKPAVKKTTCACVQTEEVRQDPIRKSRTSVSIGGMPLLGKKGGDGPLESAGDFELVGKDSSRCRKCGQNLPQKQWREIKPSPLAGNDLAFIKAEVCGYTYEMVVDTGSQITVMSEPLMRKLKLMDKLDRTSSGTAHGAGSTNILGDIRRMKVKINNSLDLTMDLTVIQMGVPMLLLGQNQMRKYKCVIDIDRDCIVFGGLGGIEVPFVQNPKGLG
eukprot:TRINITY_DN73179_c0_g1_i1.p1 TRINITY_DN73179_c0_g1~~TRINITY_DN73179_c0_g1_i1.p1  ORF type:complete len:328 (+),score=60.04 TRINITY_DN73179_c0_g1_i1:114-1097(+)